MPSLLPRWTIAPWALLYVACAYLSWSLDDPDNQLLFAWFPAGVSIAAFFVQERRHWPLLFAVLFAGGFAVEVWLGHTVRTAVWIGIVSLGSNLLTAWASQAYARCRDDMQAVCGWVVITLLVSAAASAIGALGLNPPTPDAFWRIAYMAWICNVSGILFGVAVLMGLLGFRRTEYRVGPRGYAVALAAWILMMACTWYVFDVSRPPRAEAPWLMALACVPLALTTVVTLAGGDRMGSLAVLTMAAIALREAHGAHGPFFLGGVIQGETLLLAQSYLVATALLQVFVHVLTRGPRNRIGNKQAAAADPGNERLYRLDLASGDIIWDKTDGLGRAPGTLQAMLDCVHPEDRAALATRLQGTGGARALSRPLPVRFSPAADQWITIVDHSRGALRGPDGAFIVGCWQLPGEEEGA
jgi:hypothetical protein